MTLSTSTVTLAPGSSRTYTLAPGEAVTVATEPNCYVTVTETPDVITTADQGGQTNVRTSILQYKGEWTYGPYALGGTVAVDVSLAKSTSSVSATLGSAAAAVVGAAGLAQVLLPSGGDDTVAIQSHIDTAAAAGLPAMFGPGDFIVSGQINLRSSQVLTKWSNKGLGLVVGGAGPGNTRLYYSGPSGDAMFLIDCPTAAGIGNRNYLTDISGMSILRATSGTTQIAAASTSGMAIAAVPSASGEVFHTANFRRLLIDGFDYAITLSDATLVDIDTVWFLEFLVAIRAGYNVDLLKVRHSMFGSEQFGSSYRNSAVAYQNGFNDGFNAVGAFEDAVEFEQCWFMKIGKAFELGTDLGIKGLRINKCYFENVKRYLHAQGTSGQVNAEIRGCKFSAHTVNDVTQTNPTLANYEAKFQFDGDIAAIGGVTPYLTLEDNIADYSQGANAWVSFNSRVGRVFWKNNYMRSSSSFGHIRCIKTGYATWRTLPNEGVGQWVMGDTDQGGIGLLDGEPVVVTATISAAATYNISLLSGNHFILTLPDGDCTINSLAYSGTPPSNLVSPQSKIKLTLIVPASVASTRTITWGAAMKMNAGTLTYAAADQNKRCTILLEGYAISGNGLQLVSRDPAFVAA